MTAIAQEPATHVERTGARSVRRDWMVFAVTMGVLAGPPLLFGGFYLYLACTVAILAIAALGLQVMVGLAGQLSLGHAAFMGIGAYTTILLEKSLNLPFLPAALTGALAAGGAGLLMAQLVRLSGVYFKIATFGFGVIVYQVLSNWSDLTGGFGGIRGIPPIVVLGFEVEGRRGLYILELIALGLVYAALLRLVHGRIGRAFRALGQDEIAARSVGIPTTRYRMAVITIGCGVAGFAGAFLPHLLRFINPENFTWYESIVLLIMITVGGLGSLPGAIVGAAILVVVPEYLRDFAQYKMLAFGVLLIFSMVMLPTGVAGEAARLVLDRGRRQGKAQ